MAGGVVSDQGWGARCGVKKRTLEIAGDAVFGAISTNGMNCKCQVEPTLGYIRDINLHHTLSSL
jgi:hypothetical protein